MAKKQMDMGKTKKYGKYAGMAVAGVAVVWLAIWGVRSMMEPSMKSVLAGVSDEAVSAATLNVAVLRMDAIQADAGVLKDLRAQREDYEKKLKSYVEKTQKSLESEKKDIESKQDVLSREALSKKVVDYQNKVNEFQRGVAEKAQAIDAAFQKALANVQKNHLDPVIEGIASKKKLDMIMDGRFVRISNNSAPALDITNDVVKALDKKVSKVRMDAPKGM